VCAPGGDEPRRRGIEHELQHLSSLAAHLQPAPVLVHRQHNSPLEATAEVGDARLRANTRHWS
jgi:hypothetical protein